jgi:hypothetical protein
MSADTDYATVSFALFAAALLGGCTQSVPPVHIASADQACDRTMAGLVATRSYRADQMVGCDLSETDENPELYILRVNGVCHDPQGCGSVLMGWYSVVVSNGAVYDWDVGEWQRGTRIDRQQ